MSRWVRGVLTIALGVSVFFFGLYSILGNRWVLTRWWDQVPWILLVLALISLLLVVFGLWDVIQSIVHSDDHLHRRRSVQVVGERVAGPRVLQALASSEPASD